MSTTNSLAARPLKSRLSLSSKLNTEAIPMVKPTTGRSRVSMGGVSTNPSFQIGSYSKENLNPNIAFNFNSYPKSNLEVAKSPKKEMSPKKGMSPKRSTTPKKNIRRSILAPRKSILKPQLEAEDEDTMSFPIGNRDDTTTFGKRRVSFAASAHVRMFERFEPQQAGMMQSLPAANTGPRQSSSHSRRSSIQNLASIVAPPPAEDSGEESMEIEEEDSVVAPFQGQQAFRLDITRPDDDDVEEEDEGEMDMEESRVYGGVIQHNPQIDEDDTEDEVDDDEDDEDDTADRSRNDDEEKTMDFTIAVGGLIPPAPPQGAYSDRNSIGYTIPGQLESERFLPGEGEGEGDDMSMEMDVTTAFGGIIGDESLSSAGEDMDRERTMTFSFGGFNGGGATAGGDADGMEMTIATGGIVSFQQQADQGEDEEDAMEMTIATGGILTFPQSSTSLTTNSTSLSPLRRPTNTHPSTGTPSFARPTTASAQKAKRNVFAPSPSPAKEASTPRSKAAAEVARRLSFGSTTSSGGKRVRGDEATGGSVKRRAIEGVFGSAPTSPLKSTNKSPKSLSSISSTSSHTNNTKPSTVYRGTPRKGTPKKIGFPTYHNDENGDREGGEECDTPPTISLAAFLEMTGVGFIEGFQGLTKRRSMAKGVLVAADREFELHEYAEGQMNSVFLNMYDWASQELLKDIKSGQSELHETESLSSLHNPPVIKEYLSASDEDKLLFEMTFKAFKTNTQLKARERWYDWKMGVMEKIRPDVEEMLEGMREDNEHLTQLSSLTDTLLPDLRERLASLQLELVKEREIVAQISECDQEQLALYKMDVSEQAAQIHNFTSELEESSNKLEALTSKLDEILSKKNECQNAITVARSKCDQFTKSDIVRLKEEYESLQHLHLWHTTSVTPEGLTLVYSNQLELSFTSQNYSVNTATAKVELVPGSGNGFAEGMVGVLRSGLGEIIKGKSLSAIVQQIGKFWNSHQRLQSEFTLLQSRYPISYNTTQKGDGVNANVSLVLPSVKSKVVLSFGVGFGSVKAWNVGVGVKVVYGNADGETIKQSVKSVLESAIPEACNGIFLQSCLEAVALY